jgi:hypothetical protein
MKVAAPARRVAGRHYFEVSLRVRTGNLPFLTKELNQRTFRREVFSSQRVPSPRVGAPVEILLKV